MKKDSVKIKSVLQTRGSTHESFRYKNSLQLWLEGPSAAGQNI